jgi:arginine exporter protein ArgO
MLGSGLDSFLSGVVAGYGIAIPVGPIAVLILELGLHRGFKVALSAGAGAASADLIYATVAVIAGTLAIAAIAPFAFVIRLASGICLVGIGAWLLFQQATGSSHIHKPALKAVSCPQTYGMVLGLTLLNPVTITYFTTLMLGMQAVSGSSSTPILFVLGAFLASLSWQGILAAISGLAHRRLSAKAQYATFAVGNCVIIGLGVAILLGFRI